MSEERMRVTLIVTPGYEDLEAILWHVRGRADHCEFVFYTSTQQRDTVMYLLKAADAKFIGWSHVTSEAFPPKAAIDDSDVCMVFLDPRWRTYADLIRYALDELGDDSVEVYGPNGDRYHCIGDYFDTMMEALR